MKQMNKSFSWFILIVYTLSTFGWAPLQLQGVAASVRSSPATASLRSEILQETAGCSFQEATFKVFLPLVQSGSAAASQAAPPIVSEDPASRAPVSLPSPDAETFADETAFLYQGAQPLQSGVAQSAIDPLRSGVLRGRVCARDGRPLENVQVSVLTHSEYGTTLSRADGMFDLVVNGGDLLTVVFAKTAYLTVQRQVRAPVQDFAWLPEVALIPLDGKVTAIDLNAANPMQVAQGSQVSDRDGIRQAALLIPKSTQAQLVLPGGGTQAISTLHIRATEYTVGASGPAAMPAELPPSSGYTYALEYSVDEAVAAGAVDVRFSQPLYHYVRNFLNFPVGMKVPVGYYDRQKAQWVPSENGRVVRIVSIAGGLANLDTNGDGVADNDPALGITDAERGRLPSLFPAGESLWRVPITHFTPWDCNWPYGPPPGADGPHLKQPNNNPQDCSPCSSGSVIEDENQTLGESLEINGTPYSLNYWSDRVSGRSSAYSIDIPLSESALPDGVRSIELEVTVAGQKLVKQFPPTANQHFRFTWDGKNAYGQVLNGKQAATIKVGYTYGAVYQEPAAFDKAFAALSGVPLTANKARMEVTLWQVSKATLGTWDSRSLGLGGWSLNVLHRYDTRAKVLYLGDGSRRSAAALDSGVIRTVAGGGWVAGDAIGDGGPAAQAELAWPSSLALAPGGGYYIADSGHHRIRKVDANGVITTIAGTGAFGYNGDNISAVQAQLYNPEGIALGPDGGLYIADRSNQRIRRVTPEGIITTVAGTGVHGFNGDGIPATSAKLNEPYGIAVGNDGSLYISDTRNQRIRKVSPGGTISTIAGNGTGTSAGDGGPAGLAQVHEPRGLATASDGSLYIAEYYSQKVRRVGPDGIITTVAGTGEIGYSGDGQPAITAKLNGPMGVAIGPDASLYIAEYAGNRIRRVGADGVITTVAGSSGYGFSGDSGIATRARLNSPTSVVVGTDGSFIIGDGYNQRVRQVTPILPGGSAGNIFIPSTDGNEMYVLSGSGRHLSTINALTGQPLYVFNYDGAFRVVSIIDGDGNLTAVERDASGALKAIIAPHGQRTGLATSASGYLTSLTNPLSQTTSFGYNAGGLLTSLTDARGNMYQFTYDALGLLTQDTDPAGGHIALSRTDASQSYTVDISTAMGRTNRYEVGTDSLGNRLEIRTRPDGLKDQIQTNADGTLAGVYPDGSRAQVTLDPDPRWGMAAPVIGEETQTTLGGLSNSTRITRTATLTDANDPLSLTALDESTDRNGNVFSSHYDRPSQTFTDTSPEGRTLVKTINAEGKPVLIQVGSFLPTSYTYDSQGRLVSATQGAGDEARTETYAYNSNGYLSAITDPLGLTVAFSYDAAGRVTQQQRPDGQVIAYMYDANGNLTGIVPPGKTAHTFAYNAVNLQTAYNPPDVLPGSDQTGTSYNLDRQVTASTRPDGKTVGFNYDTAGQIASLTFDRGSVQFAYNHETGNLASVAAPGGIALAFTYDGSLLTGETWSGPVAGSINFVYGNQFLPSSVKVAGDSEIAYQYDRDNLLIQAGALAMARDAQSGFPVSSLLGNISDSTTYDGFGEVSSYTASYNNLPFYSVQFTRDKLGRILQRAETISGAVESYTYAHDAAGRLVQENRNGVITSYSYDANGNRTASNGPGGVKLGTYDAQDRLLSYDSATFTYTANGELLTRSTPKGTTNYGYDSLGNLVSVGLPGGTQITYLVDGLNRRIGKKLNGALVQAFLYQDELRPIVELDGAGKVVSRFVYADDSSTPAYLIKGGATYRIIADQIGSPRLVMNSATGQLAQRLDYDAFGNVINDSSPGFQPFGFAGGLYDRDTMLVHFGARDYDSELGRWLSKDPIRFNSGQTNLYAYVENDPVNQNDPDGLESRSGGQPGKNVNVPQPKKQPSKPTQDKNKCPLPGSTGGGRGSPLL